MALVPEKPRTLIPWHIMPVHRVDEVDGNVFGVSDDEYNNDIQDSDEAGEKSDES